MDENPYRSPETTQAPRKHRAGSGRWPLVSFIGFLGGLPCGFYALVSGAHAGSIWPSVFLSAPVCLFASAVLGDNLGYAYTVIGGTGLLYGLYAYFLTTQPFMRACLIVLAIHGGSVIALLAWWQ